jgi:polysaccharide pyruvyl transferase CsaB
VGSRVLITGWSGSTNLGDELVLSGLLRLLEGHRVAVVSVDPEATQRRFDVAAVAPREVGRLRRAIRGADLLAFGGGGLLQDETSPFNLPYHLARPAFSQVSGVPFVGVGLGAGPLTRPGSRQAVGLLLRRAVAVSVRDAASQALLAECGVQARLGTDLALALPRVKAAPENVITVSLRPWGGGGGWLPVGARRRHELPETTVALLAGQLDALATQTGLGVRFVALQADRDDAVHARVADRMRAPTERVAPEVHEVVEAVTAGRIVIAMRFHAGIAAVLGSRPVVLLGYSPKVASLADELGTGGQLLAWRDEALAGLAAAGTEVLDHDAEVAAAHERLSARLTVEREVLAAGLAAASHEG